MGEGGKEGGLGMSAQSFPLTNLKTVLVYLVYIKIH